MPRRRVLVLLATVGLFATACDRDTPESAEAATPEPAEPVTPIQAKVRVQTESAAHTPLDDVARLTGTVEPYARVVVAAETSARITKRVIERGDHVDADALLFELDGSRARIEVQRAQASVAARSTDLAQAERDRSRSETLHDREGISAAALERSAHASEAAAAAEELARLSKRAAARGLRDAKIYAPFAGEIAEFHVELGTFVGPGTPVATLVDLSRVRVRVGLTAPELALVDVGDLLELEFDDLGGERLRAELRSISPLADPRTGTYAAELWLDNPDLRLRQGMIGRVSLGAGEVSQQVEANTTLTIPRAAVVRRESGYAVWIVEQREGVARVHPRALTLGRAGDERIAVLSGLEPGDEVVTEGMFALRDGAAVVVEATPAGPVSNPVPNPVSNPVPNPAVTP